MVSGRQVGQGVAVVVVLVVLNVLLFVRMSGNEHVSQPITELSRAPRSSLAVWGEQYAAACDRSPSARDNETALLLPKVAPGATVVIAPGGGGLEAEGIYRHLGKDMALSLKLILLDTRPQFAATASDRADQQLRLFLTSNSRLRRMNVASLTDVPLPPASADAVVIGHEAHHLGRLERTRFLTQMHDLLREEGQLVMLDFAPSPSTASVMAFFEKFVGPKSIFGFRGEFLMSSELMRILKDVGYAEVTASEVEYDWSFDDEEEMAQYLCSVFALTLVDLEKEEDLAQLSMAVAPLRRKGEGEGVRLTWTATRYLAVKRSVIHITQPVFPMVGTDDDDRVGIESVEENAEFQTYDLEAMIDVRMEESLEDEYLMTGTVSEEPVGVAKEKDVAGRVEMADDVGALPNDWADHRAEKGLTVKEATDYVFKEEPTVELGSGAYASCMGFSGFTPDHNSYIMEYFFRQNGWRDVTRTMISLVTERTISKLPHALAVYCTAMHSRSPQDCFVKAVTGAGNSPLADLRMIHCALPAKLTTILRTFERAKASPPAHLHSLESALPWQTGDKAGLLVSALQGASAEQQERAMRHIPRTYLVAVTCAKRVQDDQWDLWLADFFDGDQEQTTLYAKEWPTRHQVGSSNLWRSHQPALDLGNNLWISKPTFGLSYDPGQPKHSVVIPMHEGKDVELVRSPAHFLELTSGAANNCVSEYRVMQKYVEQPLLWDGYKADFRLYVAVVSVQPPVYYIYTHQAPVRVGRDPYTEDASDSDAHHITNLSKAHREDGGDVMATWDDYLEYLEGRFPGRDVREEIYSGCEEMVASVIPLLPLTDTALNGLGSSLSGWDVILDRDLNPWLMEVNRYPDWRTNISAISEFKFLLWAQYLDLVFNHDATSYPDRLGGFRRVPM